MNTTTVRVIGVHAHLGDGRSAYVSRADRPDVQLEPWRQVLLRAAELIEKRGHYRYGFGTHPSSTGPTCVLIALGIASQEQECGTVDSRNVSRAAEAVLRRSLGLSKEGSIMNWSDNTETSIVLEELRRAAVL